LEALGIFYLTYRVFLYIFPTLPAPIGGAVFFWKGTRCSRLSRYRRDVACAALMWTLRSIPSCCNRCRCLVPAPRRNTLRAVAAQRDRPPKLRKSPPARNRLSMRRSRGAKMSLRIMSAGARRRGCVPVIIARPAAAPVSTDLRLTSTKTKALPTSVCGAAGFASCEPGFFFSYLQLRRGWCIFPTNKGCYLY